MTARHVVLTVQVAVTGIADKRHADDYSGFQA